MPADEGNGSTDQADFRRLTKQAGDRDASHVLQEHVDDGDGEQDRQRLTP